MKSARGPQVATAEAERNYVLLPDDRHHARRAPVTTVALGSNRIAGTVISSHSPVNSDARQSVLTQRVQQHIFAGASHVTQRFIITICISRAMRVCDQLELELLRDE